MTEFLHDIVRERNLNQNAINNPDPWELDEVNGTYAITDSGSQALADTYRRVVLQRGLW
jgi:hypothetical protein